MTAESISNKRKDTTPWGGGVTTIFLGATTQRVYTFLSQV